ncbi:hypothetical protein [Amycolatopsis speibonae]|uniref:Uncharacterized protein n=1 Tax=Amycolatopsis speibonae TaxID=1450224 RepID=A0ABV7P7Q1_9PSEU
MKATTRAIERLRRDLPATPPPKAKAAVDGNSSAHTRRSTSGNKRRRAAGAVSWQGFAVQWLRTHPDASNRKWREAVEEAGYVGVTTAAISRLRHDAKPGKAKPSRRSVVRPTSTPTRQAGVDYCDGCGIAVRDDGLCRC